MAIFIMLNNFLHDFAVALLFASLLVLGYVHRRVNQEPHADQRPFLLGLYRRFSKVMLGCWAFIIAGGVVRTLAYSEYEWVEAAGRGQITALAVKHVLLVALVIWGTFLHLRLRKRMRSWLTGQ